MADVTLDRTAPSSPVDPPPAHQDEAVARAGESPVDPRAVRVSVAAASRLPGEDALIVAPLPEPLAPLPVSWAGRGVLGGVGTPAGHGATIDDAASGDEYLVDGIRAALHLERRGPDRARLHGAGSTTASARIVFVGEPAVGSDGLIRREIVADGWRVEVELEPERRAALRERARRGREAMSHGGPTEVHAIIPGRVVAVSVVPGDEVAAGQQILVVEAMKMQNELRSPKDGVVKRLGVAVGSTIEVGDLLVVIE